MLHNKYKRIANRSALIFGLMTLALFFTPSLADIDGFDGGFAMIAIGIFTLIIGIVTYAIYARMGKMFASMSNFEAILAQWHIGSAEYSKFAAYDVKETSAGLRSLRWLVIIITFVVGIFCALIGMEIEFVIVFCLALSAFIYLVSFIAIQAQKSKLHKSEAVIILARDGGIINGTLHPWSKMTNRLENAQIVEIEPGLYVLEITYSSPNRGSRVETTARFPVPEGKLTEAQYILGEIIKN